jgi:threonine dehydrogenase-like Zn-dependent dehydrogenase
MTTAPRHVIFGTGAIGLATFDALRRRGETAHIQTPPPGNTP